MGMGSKREKKNAIYPWGNEPIHEKPLKANFWQGHFPYDNTEQDGYYFTAPVGSFPPNDYGLFDMAEMFGSGVPTIINLIAIVLTKIKVPVKTP